MIELSEELLLRMYYKMNQARFFEEKLDELFQKEEMNGVIHSSIGQEAAGVVASLATEKGDLVSLSHRGHAQAIGYGMDVNLMMAECLGKVQGYSKGKGGPMHIMDIKSGNIGMNGIVGGGFTLSCGVALTQKYRQTKNVVLCFAGDGAAHKGSFHEALNLASIWKLPVVFLIENNQYCFSSPTEKQMNIDNISDRCDAYGIPGLTIDGNNFMEVYDNVTKALRYARAGRGPVLMEAVTYRLGRHSSRTKEGYRDEKEILAWKKKDPILRMQEYLLKKGVFTGIQIQKIVAEAKSSIDQAAEYAKESLQPPLNTVLEDVYA